MPIPLFPGAALNQRRIFVNFHPMSQNEKPQYFSALLGFARIIHKPGGVVRFKFLWGRIFLAAGILAVAMWFAGAAALYFYFKHHHGFETVSYAKTLILPFRLDEHREEMGEYHISKGLEALEAGEFRTAMHFLRVGVARSKGNPEGRMALAAIYNAGLGRPDLAAEILEGGLDLSQKNPEFLKSDYLRNLFGILLAAEFDERVISLSEELIPQMNAGSPELLFMVLASARSHIHLGNYEEAERLLDEHNLTGSPQGLLYLAEIRGNRGQTERAIEILHNALERFPDQDALYSGLMRYYRESGEWDFVRRFASLRSIRYPDRVLPRIDLLYALNATGEEVEILPTVEEILTEYPRSETALPLARFGAETGNAEVARIAYDIALEDGLDIGPFTLLLQESLLRGGQFQEALDFSDTLREERPEWLRQREDLESGLRALALQGLGRELDARIFAKEFMQSENLRPQTHVLVARLFEEKGAKYLALSILEQSYERACDDLGLP